MPFEQYLHLHAAALQPCVLIEIHRFGSANTEREAHAKDCAGHNLMIDMHQTRTNRDKQYKTVLACRLSI